MRIVKLLILILVAGAALAPVATAGFPGANGRIFFSSNRNAPVPAPGSDFEIFSMNPDGSGLVDVTNTPATPEFDVAASADGTRIVYGRITGLQKDLVVANADGSNPVQITNTAEPEDNPHFSPDGSTIVFTGNDGDAEIVTVDINGQNRHQLTNNAVGDIQPTFSPDGSLITFASKRDEPAQFDVFTMNADGSNLQNLTGVNGFFDADPSFSPDGQQIVFRSNRTGANQIFVMNANGQNETNLTNDAVPSAAPVFSPDGTRIAFDRKGTGGIDQITLIDPANGAVKQELAPSAAGTNDAPDWSRAPLVVTVAGKGKQRVDKLKARVTCSNACNLELSADGKAGKKFESQTANVNLQAGVAKDVRIRFKKRVLKRIDDRKGKATFEAIATDTIGRTDASKNVKLKP